MKNKIIFLCIFVLITSSCGRDLPKEKKILARINNYEIGAEEFDEKFRESRYGRNDSFESKKEFLAVLINRQLILQDAQGRGLDKDRDFLKMIERFWEQSLLKLAIEKKTEEIAAQAQPGARDADKEDAMRAWIDGLEKNAAIALNYDLLREGEEK